MGDFRELDARQATARPGMRHYRGAIASSISLANSPMVNAAPKSNLLMAMNTAACRVGAKATQGKMP